MSEQDQSARNIYDDHPDGFGEIPAAGTPVEMSFRADKVNGLNDLRTQAGRFGRLRSAIEMHTDMDRAVGIQFAGPKSVRMFISEHPDLIKRSAAVIGVTSAAIVTGAVVYMHEHHKRGK